MTGDKRCSEDKDDVHTDSSLEPSGWDGSLSLSVVQIVAEKEETDPAEITPLNNAIDPDALDVLFEEREPGTVSFEYLEYEIVVNEDGLVRVSNKEAE